MHRGVTGDYESAATTGEPVRAFVPRALCRPTFLWRLRYAHYAPQHATQSTREVQRREAASFVSAQEKNRRQDSESETETQSAALTC